MNSYKKQAGASLLMTLLFLGMASVILTISFKLYPAYYDNWLIVSIINSFEDEPGIKDKSVDEIESMFSKRLATNNINTFDVDEGLIIEHDSEGLYIGVDYQVTVNVYSNIDVVVKFKESIERTY